MATIKIKRKRFEREIGKLDEKMKHKIAMFGTPVEEMTGDEIHLEIFPDRPDLLSYQGYKRSFLSFLGKKTGLKKYEVKGPEKDCEVRIDPSVKGVRPFTACAIIKGLKLDDEKIRETMEVQEKLHLTLGRKRKKVAIGIYPLEGMKLPVTFKALEPEKIRFAPLESEREMTGIEILQEHPAGREYAHLLSGKSKFPVFVDAKGDVMSMPPVINSQITGKITERTEDVFVECSGFDFPVLKKCLNILATCLADMGGKIFGVNLTGRMKETTPDLSPEKRSISLKNANDLLGLDLNEKQMESLIKKMGCNYSKGKVEVPAWRTDVLHEVDLIEDVAIAYGYENFVPEIPEISTVGGESKREVLKRKFSEILSGLNFLEASNYHLTTKKDQSTTMDADGKTGKNLIEVEESKTEYSVLRGDLSHYLLKNLSENVDAPYPQKIFEIGKVFSAEDEKVRENESLALAASPGNFTEARQALEYFFRMIGLKVLFKEPDEFPPCFVDGRVASVVSKGEREIGFVGEIHPKILSRWKIKTPVALCEISLEEIFGDLD